MKSLFLALLLPLPAATGPLNDLLMAPGLLDGAGEGPLLAYSEQRMAPDGTRAAPAANGRLLVAVAPGVQGEQFLLSREVGGKSQSLGAFPASGPNPVLLYFLELTARGMASATGGSPFCIRNRMREAVAAADLGTGTSPREVVMRPFANDPNRARMGAFATLALRLRYDPDRPDRILELSADTKAAGDGYYGRLLLEE